MSDTTEKVPAKRKRTSGKRKRGGKRRKRARALPGMSQREERALLAMWARSPVVRLLANAYVDGMTASTEAARNGYVTGHVSIDDVVMYAARTWQDHVRTTRRGAR